MRLVPILVSCSPSNHMLSSTSRLVVVDATQNEGAQRREKRMGVRNAHGFGGEHGDMHAVYLQQAESCSAACLRRRGKLDPLHARGELAAAKVAAVARGAAAKEATASTTAAATAFS